MPEIARRISGPRSCNVRKPAFCLFINERDNERGGVGYSDGDWFAYHASVGVSGNVPGPRGACDNFVVSLLLLLLLLLFFKNVMKNCRDDGCPNGG